MLKDNPLILLTAFINNLDVGTYEHVGSIFVRIKSMCM